MKIENYHLNDSFSPWNCESVWILFQLREIHRKHSDLGSGTRAFEQALEKTQANIKWMKRYYSIIEKWLDDNLQDKKGSNYRLPRSLIPSMYSVELFPDIYGADPSKFTFSGIVKIDMSCNEDTNNITLNSKKLMINEKSVKILSLSTGSNIGNPGFQSLSYDEELQLVTFITRNQFIKGHNYSIEMNFTGPLLDDLQGLYYSSYKEGNITRYDFGVISQNI